MWLWYNKNKKLPSETIEGTGDFSRLLWRTILAAGSRSAITQEARTKVASRRVDELVRDRGRTVEKERNNFITCSKMKSIETSRRNTKINKMREMRREREKERMLVCACVCVCMRIYVRARAWESAIEDTKEKLIAKVKTTKNESTDRLSTMYSGISVSLVRIRVNYTNPRGGVLVFFWENGRKKKESKIDINVDTMSSTRNFGCVLVRSDVTYLPRCTIFATSRWDSRQDFR